MKPSLAAMVAGAVLALALSDTVSAGPLEDGVAAAQHGRYAKALKLLRPLAEQGQAVAQYNLGVMYYGGEGVPQAFGQAADWFRKAAEQGQSAAEFSLGMMCFQGEGLPQDYSEAAVWFAKAADQGHPDAQHQLATMYVYGQGVPQDLVRAHMWLNLAASRYPSTEAEKRDGAIVARDAIAAQMSGAQIAEAQRLADRWTPTAPAK